MKKIEILQKISDYKDKVARLQLQINQIEELCKNQEDPIFYINKPLIESRLEELSLLIFSLETNLESVLELLNSSAPFSPIDDDVLEQMMTEQVEYSESFIKPIMADIEFKINESSV